MRKGNYIGKIIVATIIICCPFFLFAQSIPVGIGTNTPDSKSILHINSTTKGVLIPRLSSTQQSTLATTLNTNHKGLMVADSATGATLYWNGAAWKDCDPLTITTTPPLSVLSTNIVALNPGTAAGDLITWDGLNWVNSQPAIQHFNIGANNLQPYLVLNYCIALQGVFPSRTGLEPFLAQLGLFSFLFTPKGWAQCNGQLLPIYQNQALFSLLGTQYGGNGQTTFALPDLRGKVPIHLSATHPIGEIGGEQNNYITK